MTPSRRHAVTPSRRGMPLAGEPTMALARILRAAGLALLALVLVVATAGVMVWLNTGWGKSVLRERIASAAPGLSVAQVPSVLGIVRNAFVVGLPGGFSHLPPVKAGERQSLIHQVASAVKPESGPPKAQPPSNGQ